jgi:hypothetical protein
VVDDRITSERQKQTPPPSRLASANKSVDVPKLCAHSVSAHAAQELEHSWCVLESAQEQGILVLENISEKIQKYS